MIYAALASYGVPIYVMAMRRFPVVSPPVFLMLFFLIAYGPHTCFRYLLEESRYLPERAHDTYLAMVTIANFGLALGFSVGSVLLTRAERKIMMDRVLARAKPLSRMQKLAPLAAISLAISASILSLDAPYFPRTTEHIRFFFMESEFSYTEIRRIMFSEAAITAAQNYVRNGIGPFLISLLAIKVIFNSKFGMERVFLSGVALVVFTATILALNKLPILYTVVCASGAAYLYKKGAVVGVVRRLPLVIGGLLVMLGFLEVLYRIQYSDAIQSGKVSVDQLRELLLYRPFVGQADMLRFWAEQWPYRQEHIGFRNFRPIAVLFGLDYYLPTQELPQVYLRGSLTSWQTGFMGSGYASWGLPGVFLYGSLCSLLAVIVTKVVTNLKHRDLAAAAMAVCSLTMFFLTSTELSIALLSGGTILTPLFAKMLDVWVGKVRDDRRGHHRSSSRTSRRQSMS